jgi:hypothetical protein
MRTIAQTTTEALHDRQPLAWHPNADMIIGEQYLAVDVTDLPTKPTSSQPSPDQESVAAPPLADAADLIRLVLAPGELDNLDPGALASERFRFYAIVWRTDLLITQADGHVRAPLALTSRGGTVVEHAAGSPRRPGGC